MLKYRHFLATDSTDELLYTDVLEFYIKVTLVWFNGLILMACQPV